MSTIKIRKKGTPKAENVFSENLKKKIASPGVTPPEKKAGKKPRKKMCVFCRKMFPVYKIGIYSLSNAYVTKKVAACTPCIQTKVRENTTIRVLKAPKAAFGKKGRKGKKKIQ